MPSVQAETPYRGSIILVKPGNPDIEFFYYVGICVVSGTDNEGPVIHDLVEDFVSWHGKKAMKWLIVDRDFLDGEWIGRCKTEWNIDVLIPARNNMNIYTDVVGLAEGGMVDFEPWIPPTTSPQAGSPKQT